MTVLFRFILVWHGSWIIFWCNSFPKQIYSPVKKLSLALLILFFTFNSIESDAQQASSNNTTNFYSGSYDDFLREARKQGKVAILDFWAAWCAPCKKMDKETFTNAELAKHLNENFLIYKVNVDTFDGMEIANRFGVESFPTIITLNSRGRFMNELKGFLPANHLTEKLNQSSKQPQTYVSLWSLYNPFIHELELKNCYRNFVGWNYRMTYSYEPPKAR